MNSINQAEVVNTETGETQPTLILVKKSDYPKDNQHKEIVSYIRANPGVPIYKLAEVFEMKYAMMESALTAIGLEGVELGEDNGRVVITKENGKIKDYGFVSIPLVKLTREQKLFKALENIKLAYYINETDPKVANIMLEIANQAIKENGVYKE